MTFTRLINKLSARTLDDMPVGSLFDLSGEPLLCLVSLFVSSSIYGIIGYYLTVKTNSIFKKVKLSKISVSASESADNFHNNDVSQESQSVSAIIENKEMFKYAMVASNLFKSYTIDSRSKVDALKDVSFKIDKGEIFGLLGPNGAGKTTLIGILTGFHKPDLGSTFIEGFDIDGEMEAIHKMIGVCPQFDCLWSDLTVEEHLLFYLRIRGMPRSLEQQYVQSALEKIHLAEARDKKVIELSGGMKRRVSIGIAVAGSTRLVILDEPTTGLDPINRIQIWNIIKEIKKENSILLTTHLMNEADQLCDRVGIINHGELLCVDYNLNIKKKFGNGFVFTLIFDDNSHGDKVKVFDKFLHDFKSQFTIVSQSQKTVVLQFDSDEESLVQFCDKLQTNSASFGLLSWNLTQSSMEDVFINIIKHHIG